MKRYAGLTAVAVLALALVAIKLNAQDPLAVAPEMYKLDFENARVRVMDVTFQPGQKIAAHSHPDHVAYVLQGGKLRMYQADGTSSEMELQTGQTLWLPAQKHWAENIGTSVIHILVTELKEPAPAAPAAAAPAAEQTEPAAANQ